MSRKIVSPASEFSSRRLMPEVEKGVENTRRACSKYLLFQKIICLMKTKLRVRVFSYHLHAINAVRCVS